MLGLLSSKPVCNRWIIRVWQKDRISTVRRGTSGSGLTPKTPNRLVLAFSGLLALSHGSILPGTYISFGSERAATLQRLTVGAVVSENNRPCPSVIDSPAAIGACKAAYILRF